jgi:cytochrome c-type biogenesis protein CcmE
MGRLILLLIVLAWIAYTVAITTGYLYRGRVMKGLHEPELWLPRKERQAHARKLLAREDDDYTEKLMERLRQQSSPLNQKGTITP